MKLWIYTNSVLHKYETLKLVYYSRPTKIVAAKGKHNNGAIMSGERGTNVTVATAVSASGNSVPPMFVFPRKNYKDYYVNNGPPECIGIGKGSGWVTGIEFKKYVQHFIKHVKPSNEYQVLLILENHSSRLQFETLNLAKENGIVWIQCQYCN